MTRVTAAIADFVAAQRRAYGWTHVDVDAAIDPGGRRIVLRGTVLMRRLRPRLRAAIDDVLDTGWTLDDDEVQPLAPGPWHAVQHELTSLFAAIVDDDRPARLATQLTNDDGPVRTVATHEHWTLVEAIDGTMGWTPQPLGPRTDPPRLSITPPDGAAILAAARHHLGAPYLLGGTTLAGIDCSGLAQRALRQVAGGWIPRHTTDQLALGPAEGPGEDLAATLVFVWSNDEAPGHVGLADGEGRVVHASRSRGVVDDPRARFVRDARRLMHVPWAAVAQLQARLSGRASLLDVLELGRPADVVSARRV